PMDTTCGCPAADQCNSNSRRLRALSRSTFSAHFSPDTNGVRSWDGQVEKVTTLKMTPSSASAAASASASNDDNANIGQPMQKQQLLGRIMLATNKNNSAAG
uniref:AWS domain-containing protein n=1 Tax=Globodera pallida TaxID=36090 RepID=A0A183CLZ0_GLOPA